MFERLNNFLENPETILSIVVLLSICAYGIYRDLVRVQANQVRQLAELEERVSELETERLEIKRHGQNY